ncbi:MAG: D-2-hydroxyacid dehydrogenase [Halioglobus sp.]|nr:D-2-hydroxyacid dehydrogenase [Halioglobus sp.]
MAPFKLWPLLAILLALCAAPASFGGKPSSHAQALIEELGLRPADKSMAEYPGWKPQRVAVMLISKPGTAATTIEEEFQAAAGNVELVFLRPGGKKLSRELLAGVDGVIGMCTPALLQQADATLRWVHNYSVGMDYCKGFSETQLTDIVFTNNKRLSGPAIAEHTIAMLLALTHNLPAYHQAQRALKWHRKPSRNITFGELKGKTLLVVGLGGIGTEIAWRAHGLGMRVIATRNSSRNGPEYVDYVGLPSELLALAAQADVVVNALPLTPQTNGLFDTAFFDAVKPNAIFLAVGRGKSTVTSDLIAALEAGKLFGAGLDVTDPEPLPKTNPLWKMPNVILTPHVSAAGPDSTKRTMTIAVENLRRYAEGEPLLNAVDMTRGY